MSYEIFRTQIVAQLPENPTREDFLRIMDEAAQNYDFTRKETALTVYGQIPEAVRLYVASKAVENCAKGTLAGYTQVLCAFFDKVRKPVQEVTQNDVRLYLAWYMSTRNVQGSTIDRIRRVLNGFWAWCIDEDLAVKNPVKRIEEVKTQKKKLRGLLPMELEYMRSACENDRERALLEFMYSTGCRVSEVANMTLSCVDFHEGTVEVIQGKGNKDRTTFLNAKATVAVQAYLAGRRYASEYLFNSTRAPGGRITTKAIEDLIRDIASRVADKLKIKVTPHTLRRTTATIAWHNGMPIEQIRIMLGHAKLETTMRYINFDYSDVKSNHAKFVA